LPQPSRVAAQRFFASDDLIQRRRFLRAEEGQSVTPPMVPSRPPNWHPFSPPTDTGHEEDACQRLAARAGAPQATGLPTKGKSQKY